MMASAAVQGGYVPISMAAAAYAPQMNGAGLLHPGAASMLAAGQQTAAPQTAATANGLALSPAMNAAAAAAMALQQQQQATSLPSSIASVVSDSYYCNGSNVITTQTSSSSALPPLDHRPVTPASSHSPTPFSSSSPHTQDQQHMPPPPQDDDKSAEYLKELISERDNLEAMLSSDSKNGSSPSSSPASSQTERTQHALKLLEQGRSSRTSIDPCLDIASVAAAETPSTQFAAISFSYLFSFLISAPESRSPLICHPLHNRKGPPLSRCVIHISITYRVSTDRPLCTHEMDPDKKINPTFL